LPETVAESRAARVFIIGFWTILFFGARGSLAALHGFLFFSVVRFTERSRFVWLATRFFCQKMIKLIDFFLVFFDIFCVKKPLVEFQMNLLQTFCLSVSFDFLLFFEIKGGGVFGRQCR
jgi:hypothetical protein